MTTNDLAKGIWEDIKKEELKHVGELLGLLNYLEPSQMQFVKEGLSEFNKMLNNNK